MKMKLCSKAGIASDVAIFKNWMERGNSSNVLDTNETVCPSILFLIRFICLTEEGVGGVGGEEREDKGHCLAVLNPPAPTRDLAHRPHRLNTCERAFFN